MRSRQPLCAGRREIVDAPKDVAAEDQRASVALSVAHRYPSAMQHTLLAALALFTCACASTRTVETWGTMREVLRGGQSEGRVDLVDFKSDGGEQGEWIGVGAMAGLQGEVTLAAKRVWIAEARDGGATVREARAGDQAALLIAAKVREWKVFALGSVADLADLEARIAAILDEQGWPRTDPIPLRVIGQAYDLDLHVIDGACPIANPTGPPPFRATRSGNVTLVGFFAEGAAGVITHHDRRTHLHAILTGAEPLTGHLDALSLDNALLSLPVR